MGSQMALVKGNRQMGFQVGQATHILWFWLKEVARWDLRLMKKREKREREEKETKKREKKVRPLDE
jgi:hypothetical protein